MNGQRSDHPRERVVARASSQLLAQLLDSLGDSQAVVNASLCLAMSVLSADRGLAFDSSGALAAIGFSQEEADAIRCRQGGALLAGGRPRYYADGGFAEPARDAGPIQAMAGAIEVALAALVLAIQRDHLPFSEAEQEDLAALLDLLRAPFEVTAELRRWTPKFSAPGRRLTHLPISALAYLPQIREVERMLIQEALLRAGNNKSAAARTLGVTREGLRKKIIRFRMASL